MIQALYVNEGVEWVNTPARLSFKDDSNQRIVYFPFLNGAIM
ncbi:hypothetical protein [Staphylococcus schleiferi]|nr:hypothetical protein [Staphylococcus schleiferi]